MLSVFLNRIPLQQQRRRKRRPATRRNGGKQNGQGLISMAVIAGNSAVAAVSRAPAQMMLRVHKWTANTTITQALANNFGAFDFRMSYLDETAQYALLYQQYRIEKVEVFLRPMFRATSIIDDAVVLMPLIYVASDPNDITAWTALTEAQRFENVQVMDDAEAFCVAFSPQPAIAAYFNGAFTGFAQSSANMWIDTNYAAVPHFGFKWAITGNGLVSNYQVWSLAVRYTAVFRLGK
jgi:hypothetical protein